MTVDIYTLAGIVAGSTVVGFVAAVGSIFWLVVVMQRRNERKGT